MQRHLLSVFAFGLLSATFIACESGQEKKAKAPASAPVSGNEQAASQPDKSAKDGHVKQKRSVDECVGPFVSSPATTVTINGRDWLLEGSTLTEKTTDPDDIMVVGLIADIKEDAPENLQNLDHILSFFRQERVEFIIVDGDTGENKSQVANSLRRLAQSGLPVGIIIGNRECRADFVGAFNEVSAKFKNVFNLNAVRHIIADDAEFITMPGYFNPAYLHCVQDGCQYYEDDVMALAPLVEHATHPLTIISHGPPKQNGPGAIDRISEGSNEGDPSLTDFIREKKIPFGLFANIHEAGGHATDLSGENPVKEGVFVDSFYLNPGPADAVRWTMNDGRESIGMAAVVTYKGKLASYHVFRIGAPSAKPGHR